MKRYMCFWSAVSYGKDMVEVHDNTFFTEEAGYSKDDIEGILTLKFGQSFVSQHSILPDHVVTCIEDGPIDAYQCANCDFTGCRDEFPYAQNLHLRVLPGETYTDKQCPRCAALAFPL